MGQSVDHSLFAGADPWLGVNSPEESDGFALGQNYPNPFNPTTGIRYQVGQLGPAGGRTGVPGVSEVKITVYDVLGREVAVLVDERKPAGTYEVRVDGSELASGMYVYRLIAGSFVQSRKMLLLR